MLSKEEINIAKSCLWEKCGHLDIMDKMVHRMDSASRGAEHAELEDIIDGIQKLFTIDTPPSFIVSACDIHRLPRCQPGELIEPSILQRLLTVEAQMKQLHQSMDSTVTRCIESDDKVSAIATKIQMSPYIGAAQSTKTPVILSAPSADLSYAPLTVKMPPPGQKKTTTTKSHSQREVRNDGRKSSEKPSTKAPSLESQPGAPAGSAQDDDGFTLPRYVQRKQLRDNQRQGIRGSAPATGTLRGAPVNPPNRDLFIYKVHKDVDSHELENVISSNGFTIVQFKCVSHMEAKYKSFQLTVPRAEFSRLFDSNIWPEGICVRKFRSKQQSL